jgi:hypothetical protein
MQTKEHGFLKKAAPKNFASGAKAVGTLGAKVFGGAFLQSSDRFVLPLKTCTPSPRR